MKTKVAIVPKWEPKPKAAPDATVYLTRDGTRVILAKSKEFPTYAGEPEYMKALRNDPRHIAVVRISDGHELWGYKMEDLTPEKK
jgi:hypothetical protein